MPPTALESGVPRPQCTGSRSPSIGLSTVCDLRPLLTCVCIRAGTGNRLKETLCRPVAKPEFQVGGELIHFDIRGQSGPFDGFANCPPLFDCVQQLEFSA